MYSVGGLVRTRPLSPGPFPQLWGQGEPVGVWVVELPYGWTCATRNLMGIVGTDAACSSGRWVLAEIPTGSRLLWEATYAPDITGEEWRAIRRELPDSARVVSVETVGGQLLGIPLAIMALIA